MYKIVQNKIISKLIFNKDILTLLLKSDFKDENADCSINFIGTAFFYETGVVNQKIMNINQGLLGFSSRNYIVRQNLEPNEFIQFYLDVHKEITNTEKLEMIVVCKSITISDNPYSLLPVD